MMQDEVVIKNLILIKSKMLKSGQLFKLGDGPINYNWNLRYFVLDEQNQELTYYESEQDMQPRGIFSVADALVSNITLIKERENSFSIQSNPHLNSAPRTLFLSANTFDQSNEWRDALIAAAKGHKDKRAQASFQVKSIKQQIQNNPLRMSHMNPNAIGGALGTSQQEVWRRGSWDERELLGGDDFEDGGLEGGYGGPTPGGDQDGDLKYVEIDAINQKVVKRFSNTMGPGGFGLNSSRMSQSSFNNPFKLGKPPSQSIQEHDELPLEEEDDNDEVALETIEEFEAQESPDLIETDREPVPSHSASKQRRTRRGQKSEPQQSNKDLGIITEEQAKYLNQIQDYIKEDLGQISSPQNSWETVKLSNDVHIQALNPATNKVSVNMGKLVKHFLIMALVYLAFNLVNLVYGHHFGYFWLGLIMQLISFKTLKGLVSIRPKYTLLKARTLIKGDAYDLGREYLKNYQFFDYMLAEQIDYLHNKEAHTVITDEVVDMPSHFQVRALLPRVHRKMITYWGVDELGCFYVLRSSFSDAAGQAQKSIHEAFVCVPLKVKGREKSLLYFFSDFNFQETTSKIKPNPLILNNFVHDQIKLERLNVLASFIEYHKRQVEGKIKDLYLLAFKNGQEEPASQSFLPPAKGPKQTRRFQLPIVDIDGDIKISNPRGHAADQSFVEQTSNIMQGSSGGPTPTIKRAQRENPKNIRLRGGQRMPLSERFPGYFRMDNGALWCHNQDEMASQSAIIMEVIQKQGETLMDGRDIVTVSLPVQLFEKRSLVEKICDLWCTGPHFLRIAALETNPLERMKYVITFMVSGMHQIASQKKPFHPIVGETFQGVWPEGSNIYVEHISYNPPISSFLVENPEGLFQFEGFYEYQCKLADVGNSAQGRLAGKQRVRFPSDGTIIEFEYPSLKFEGLLYGRRTSNWFGSFEFNDSKNNLKATLLFSEGPGFFNRFALPVDCLEGSITHNGQDVSKIQGSWLEFLRFDDKTCWELETCDAVKPMPVDLSLPSDCRYREDSIAFGMGDIKKAQQEKERLEGKQRAEKKRREVNAEWRKLGIKQSYTKM